MLCGDVTNLFLVAFICLAPFRSFCGEYGEHIKVDTLNFMNHLCEIKRLKMILFRFYIFLLFAIRTLQVSCAHRIEARCICAPTGTSLFIAHGKQERRNDNRFAWNFRSLLCYFFIYFFYSKALSPVRVPNDISMETEQQSTIRPKGSK